MSPSCKLTACGGAHDDQRCYCSSLTCWLGGWRRHPRSFHAQCRVRHPIRRHLKAHWRYPMRYFGYHTDALSGTMANEFLNTKGWGSRGRSSQKAVPDHTRSLARGSCQPSAGSLAAKWWDIVIMMLILRIFFLLMLQVHIAIALYSC
jgi:hypothetical protein